MSRSRRKRRGLCGICPAGCWIEAEYDKEGRIVAVRPDEGTELGIICKVGEHSPDIICSPHRLKYPLKLKGPKGTYDFERITWDEAFDIIVHKLNTAKKEHGPETAAIYTKGLSRKNKMLPCKYIYDDRGSRLFQEIMDLPEYYLTGCEIEILRESREFLGDLLNERKFNLFELGAGDGKKTRILLDHFQKREIDFRYIPIDISSSVSI